MLTLYKVAAYLRLDSIARAAARLIARDRLARS